MASSRRIPTTRPCHGVLNFLFRLMVLAVLIVTAVPTGQAQDTNPQSVSKATEQLFKAVTGNNLGAVQTSIGDGADIAAINARGQTAVELAVDKGYFEIAHYILSVRKLRREAELQAIDDAPKADSPAPSTATAPPQVSDAAPSPQTAKPPSVKAWPESRANPFDPGNIPRGSVLPLMGDIKEPATPAAEAPEMAIAEPPPPPAAPEPAPEETAVFSEETSAEPETASEDTDATSPQQPLAAPEQPAPEAEPEQTATLPEEPARSEPAPAADVPDAPAPEADTVAADSQQQETPATDLAEQAPDRASEPQSPAADGPDGTLKADLPPEQTAAAAPPPPPAAPDTPSNSFELPAEPTATVDETPGETQAATSPEPAAPMEQPAATEPEAEPTLADTAVTGPAEIAETPSPDQQPADTVAETVAARQPAEPDIGDKAPAESIPAPLAEIADTPEAAETPSEQQPVPISKTAPTTAEEAAPSLNEAVTQMAESGPAETNGEGESVIEKLAREIETNKLAAPAESPAEKTETEPAPTLPSSERLAATPPTAIPAPSAAANAPAPPAKKGFLDRLSDLFNATKEKILPKSREPDKPPAPETLTAQPGPSKGATGQTSPPPVRLAFNEGIVSEENRSTLFREPSLPLGSVMSDARAASPGNIPARFLEMRDDLFQPEIPKPVTSTQVAAAVKALQGQPPLTFEEGILTELPPPSGALASRSKPKQPASEVADSGDLASSLDEPDIKDGEADSGLPSELTEALSEETPTESDDLPASLAELDQPEAAEPGKELNQDFLPSILDEQESEAATVTARKASGAPLPPEPIGPDAPGAQAPLSTLVEAEDGKPSPDEGEASPQTAALPASVVRNIQPKDFVLAIGNDLLLGRALGTTKVDKKKSCLNKVRDTVTFCVEPVTWSKDIQPLFNVSTIMYRGVKTIVRYDEGQATYYHVLYPTESFDEISSYLSRRYGDPSETWNRSIASMGKPRSDNPTLVWKTIDPESNLTTTLEVRKFDDSRGGFPDNRRGVILLYHEKSQPVFPLLSIIELMQLRSNRYDFTRGKGGAATVAPKGKGKPADVDEDDDTEINIESDLELKL